MESIEIEGSSIEEAVERACDALNTNEENLEYEIKESKTKGKRVKIVARKREGAQGQTNLSDFAKKAKEVLEKIVTKVGEEYSVNAYEFPDKLVLNINGDGSGLLIGKKGQTLDAIQHIIIKIAQKSESEGRNKKIIVDTEKYREKRIDYLKELAKKLAEKAIKTGKPVSVNPMSSFERRIVHITLDNIDGVYTESVGEGPERKVMIMPKGSNRRRSNRYRNG